MAKQFKKFLDMSFIHILVMTWCLPNPILARDEKSENNLLGTAGQVFKQVSDDMMQMKQQQLADVSNQQMMSQFRPKMVPSKFFPMCPVTMAITTHPENACINPVNPADQAGVQQMRYFKQMAASQINFFDQLMSVGQKGPNPVGLECLELQKSKTMDHIQDHLNMLEAQIGEINKRNQLFKEQNKELTDNMKKLASELYGTGKSQDIDTKTNKLAAYFSPACRDIIGDKNMMDAQIQVGLIGLRDVNMLGINQTAVRTIQNKELYESELKKNIEQVKKQIKDQGPEAWDPKSLGEDVIPGQAVFQSSIAVISQEKQKFQREISRIRKTLKDELDFDLPELDHNYAHNMDSFVNNAKDFFRKRYINDCVTGKADGVGIPLETIYNSLQQVSTNSVGDTTIRYRESLKSIMNSDAFIEDKMLALKELDDRFGAGNITIRYNTSDSKLVTESPYQLFQKTVQVCKQALDQDDTFSPDNTGSKSMASKIQRGQNYLNKVRSLHQGFASTIANNIFEQVNNCGGLDLKAGSCNEEQMNPKGNQFCIKHAVSCATAVRSCYDQVTAKVEQRKNQIKAFAVAYNNRIAGLVGQQEMILGQIKSQVMKTAEFMKSIYPNSAYEFPKDLFVKMPEPSKHPEFGVDIRGGGGNAIFEDLPKKIGLLKTMLKKQKSKVDKSINQYIATEKKSIQKNKRIWEKIKDNCNAREKDLALASAEMNKGMQKSQEEMGIFCRKYDRLRKNPAAGCGDKFSAEDLFEDALKVASRINPEAIEVIGAYADYCAQSQNEAEKGSEDEDSNDKENIISKLCVDKNNEADKVNAQIAKTMTQYIPTDLEDKISEEKIKNWIESGDPDDITKDLKKIESKLHLTSFGRAILESAELNNQKSTRLTIEDLKKVMAKRLLDINDTTDTEKDIFQKRFNSLLDEIKGQDSFCSSNEREALAKAIELSAKGDDLKNNFKDELEKQDEPEYYKKASRSLASLQGESAMDRLSELGELGASVACVAQAEKPRSFLDELGEFDADILGEEAMENFDR